MVVFKNGLNGEAELTTNYMFCKRHRYNKSNENNWVEMGWACHDSGGWGDNNNNNNNNNIDY